MPDQPGASEVHVDALLTNISVGYSNALYIAREIFPVVQVMKQSDIVPKYDKSDWFRDEAKALSEMEAPPISGYGVDVTDTYYCQPYGQGHAISDQRRANTDAPFDADRDGTRWATDKLELKNERMWVSDFWKTGVWGTDKTGGGDFTKWSVYATSTPIQDIRGFKRDIRRALGGWNPNTLVLGDLTYDKLADHPNILDRIKYGSNSDSPAMVNRQLMAQLLELDRVLVGISMYTADEEGTAEASVTYTANWDDDAWLGYVSPSPALFNPSAGYTFVWQTVFGGTRFVKRRRDPISDRGDLIEVFEAWDQKAVASDAGLFMSDAVDA
jgi:hypothetical protein